MASFILRYKIPPSRVRGESESGLKRREARAREKALVMAKEVMRVADSIFFWEINSYEVRPFADSFNMTDFDICGWVIDNNDQCESEVSAAQVLTLTAMKALATVDQQVVCSWQRVKGIWGYSNGLSGYSNGLKED